MTKSPNALPKQMEVEASERKLRIAFVYSRMPFPMMRGDQLTVAHLLSFLAARGHEVDFFTLDADGHASEAQMQWLESACRTVKMYPHGKVQKALGIVGGLLRGLPLQVGVFNNRKLNRDVRKGAMEGKYDVIYVYYLRSAEVIDGGLEEPQIAGRAGHPMVTVLAMQLSQSLNTRRIYQNAASSAIKKFFYGIETLLVPRYEARVWRRFTRCVLIGPRDVEAIRQECREQKVPEISNWIYGAHGTDVKRFYPASASDIVPGRIVFSGGMQYNPNAQAIEWFVENCWDAIRASAPLAELIIQGQNPGPAIKRLHGMKGITVTGTVPDVSTMIRSAAVCINPMMAAGGMQNKLIEYFACGKAVVATAVANEGIGAVTGRHFLEANTAEEFVSAVLYLLNNDEYSAQLGEASREFVLKDWTWEAHFMKLERDLTAALDERSSAAATESELSQVNSGYSGSAA